MFITSIVSQASEHTLMKSLHYVKTMGKNEEEKKDNRLIKATKNETIFTSGVFFLFYKYVKCTSLYTKRTFGGQAM